MTISSNSQSPYFIAPSLISQQLQIVVDAWSWAPPLHNVAGEEPIYLCAQNGASVGDMVQQRQRRQWGIDFVPPFHPSSSTLAPMMEHSWLPLSPTVCSLPSPGWYPTPESLFSNDYSPMPSDLPDLLSDGGFEWAEEYLDSAIEIPPDRDNCSPTTRETPNTKHDLLAGQARAGATGLTSSAIESVEAPSMNSHLLNQPSSVERQEIGAAPGGDAPSHSSSPSIIPTSCPLSWHANDPRMTLPSPAVTAPSTSPTMRPPFPPSSAATPSAVPSKRHKRRRNGADVTDKKKRRLTTKNPRRKREKSNEFYQDEISGWTIEDGKTFTKDKFRNSFGASRK